MTSLVGAFSPLDPTASLLAEAEWLLGLASVVARSDSNAVVMSSPLAEFEATGATGAEGPAEPLHQFRVGRAPFGAKFLSDLVNIGAEPEESPQHGGVIHLEAHGNLPR